jgi:hypothetical protein
MFETLKRWMHKSAPAADADQKVLSAWAKGAGHTLKAVTGGAPGAVVQSASGWRLEWGRSQRPYFPGHELRFRSESGLTPDVQMLWLSKTFAQTLEGEVFQRFTDANQTRIDSSMPDEMRWLAMHPKVSLAPYPLLVKRFWLLSNAPQVASQWLEGELSTALEVAAASWWVDQAGVLITVNRGILTLRMNGDGIEPNQLAMVSSLFDVAAQRVKALA